MALKHDLTADVQRRQQRLRALRDMTQDRDERVRLDAELHAMQVTLSDLESIDEDTLRRQRAKRRRARAFTAPSRTAQVAAAMFVLAIVAVFGAAVLRSRRKAR
jgi:hypothetical protein